MEFELQSTLDEGASTDEVAATESSSFRLSARPVVARIADGEGVNDSLQLPRTYGTQTLCLMARDPRTLFAYWDIDWAAAFREETPKDRKVHLRVFSEKEVELSLVEVEPMAGSCYLTVTDADAVYQGEIGFFSTAGTWKTLARSKVVTTPADSMSANAEVDFATVPFHLSFQHMIDLLRITKQENESLTSMLADLRARAAAPERRSELSAEEHELACVLEEAATSSSSGGGLPERSDFWTAERIQRILGVGGASSPSEGFGDDGRGGGAGHLGPITSFGGSSRAL